MKNSGTRKAMQTPTWRSICAMLCLLLLLSALFPVKAAAETVPAKVVRVGSFEDTFNYVNEKGIRKGYGYELLQTLSGYTGWQLEYVTCDWSDCFEKLKNGEIDIMGDISYTEDRTEEMLFSDEPMGEEKDYLYADLSREDITASDFKTLNGKKIGVLMGTEPEVMLTEWEEKYDLKTQHVNIANNEDAKQKLANHEIDCFVSMEESFWTELGISTITRVGSSDIYYAINKDRADIKEELDNAMRALEDADPFYTADLYKRYFSMDYTPILTGEEKAWLKKHGAIRMGFLTGDSGVSVYDPSTGELTGTITDYIRFAKDCLGNQELEFQMVGYDSQKAELDALKSGEIDMVFHFDQSPNLAEEYRVACTNTTWTSNMMAVTNKEHFNETQANRVAVPQNKISLTRYLAVYYPQWEIVDCAAQEDAARLVKDGQADCFVTGVSSQENYCYTDGSMWGSFSGPSTSVGGDSISHVYGYWYNYDENGEKNFVIHLLGNQDADGTVRPTDVEGGADADVFVFDTDHGAYSMEASLSYGVMGGAITRNINIYGQPYAPAKSLTIDASNLRTFYTGDTFNPAELVVTATRANGAEESIWGGRLTFTGYDSDTTGTKTVTASFLGATATFEVQVEELVTEQYTGSYELVQGETPTATDAVLLVDYSHKVCTLTAADGSASITGTLVDAQDDALTMTLNGSDALTVPITEGEDGSKQLTIPAHDEIVSGWGSSTTYSINEAVVTLAAE